jgi:hypothetical protein
MLCDSKTGELQLDGTNLASRLPIPKEIDENPAEVRWQNLWALARFATRRATPNTQDPTPSHSARKAVISIHFFENRLSTLDLPMQTGFLRVEDAETRRTANPVSV